MSHRPTQEWLKPDEFTGTYTKVGNSLPLPDDERLTLEGSRARNGEVSDYRPGANFYKVGPLTAKADPPKVFIGGHAPDSESLTIVKPLPGARRQLINPDDTKPIAYPGGQ